MINLHLIVIPPMISSLSLMENANSESVVGLGLSIIALNLGMYL